MTVLGQVLSSFPLDPPYAKSLLAFDRLAGHQPRYDDMLTLVSVLSAENVWTPVSKNDVAKTERFEEVRRSLAVAGSDHMGLVRVFDEWGQNRDDWCFKNFIQLRALRQARNIREQLSEHMRGVRWEEIKRFFKRGPSVKERQSYQERSKLLRQALGVGFFMNTARRIPHHSKEGTYLTVNEGLQVRVDRSSIISI